MDGGRMDDGWIAKIENSSFCGSIIFKLILKDREPEFIPKQLQSH